MFQILGHGGLNSKLSSPRSQQFSSVFDDKNSVKFCWGIKIQALHHYFYDTEEKSRVPRVLLEDVIQKNSAIGAAASPLNTRETLCWP